MKKATIGWAGLFTYVLIYDIWAGIRGHETLSACCWRGLKHPSARIFVWGVGGVITKHLFLPEVLPQLDPLKSSGNTIGRLAGNRWQIG